MEFPHCGCWKSRWFYDGFLTLCINDVHLSNYASEYNPLRHASEYNPLQVLCHVPHQLVREVVDQGEHNRVRGSDNELRATRGQTQQNTRREENKENRHKQTHPDVHLLYSGQRFFKGI